MIQYKMKPSSIDAKTRLWSTSKLPLRIRSSRHIKMVVDMAMPKMILLSVCKNFGASKPIDILVSDHMEYHRHLSDFLDVYDETFFLSNHLFDLLS